MWLMKNRFLKSASYLGIQGVPPELLTPGTVRMNVWPAVTGAAGNQQLLSVIKDSRKHFSMGKSPVQTPLSSSVHLLIIDF